MRVWFSQEPHTTSSPSGTWRLGEGLEVLVAFLAMWLVLWERDPLESSAQGSCQPRQSRHPDKSLSTTHLRCQLEFVEKWKIIQT